MDQKQLGAFYTPAHTVGYILRKMNKILIFDENSVILEPSGGDGIFISGLVKQYNRVNTKNIDVRDINKEVTETITSYGVNFTNKDSLLQNDVEYSLFSSETQKKKYSHIIGNPPYLNKQSEYIKKNKAILKKKYEEIGVHDTYAMFIYLGCKLLKDGGILGFIVSDTFLTLGIHKNFRKFLLENFSIHEITICPKKLFEGVSVNTCIIIIENKCPTHESKFIINDCRNCTPGEYDGISYIFNQIETLKSPDYVFNFEGNSELIKYINNTDKIIDYVEGGLGMHTKDNNKYLSIIDYNGIQYAKRKSINGRVIEKEIDGIHRKFYHKQGGDYKYFLPAEYAVRRDPESVNNYVIPKNAAIDNNRQGFIISGVCSKLSARLSTIGAMRESNKAMCFFPKDPVVYPSEYFIGLLNSSIYAKFIKLLNHTNSIQIRDIYKLPMIHLVEGDKALVISIVRQIIESKKRDIDYDCGNEQKEIDKIIEKYFI